MRKHIGFVALAAALFSLMPALPGGAQIGLEECVDPYPCEVAWPAGLEGPFQAAPVELVEVVAHDGVVLNGWVRRPVVPEGTKVPVVLHSSPYLGMCGYSIDLPCDPSPADAQWWSDTPPPAATINGLMIPPIRFVRAGYAVAYFDVRGTGLSGGCFDFQGHDEQRDQATIVDWLGGRPWSNKRVGMGGASYMSGTSWEAAISAPKALRTVIVAGNMSDLYTLEHSPQGAHSGLMAYLTAVYTNTSFVPPKHALLPPDASSAWIDRLDERACDDVRESGIFGFLRAMTTEGVVDLRGERNAGFWDERRLLDGYPDVRASVLMAHGFRDFGHTWQEDLVSATIRSPFRQVEGQWGHTFPIGASHLPAEWARDTHPHCTAQEIWCQMTFDWLDYWLKGVGARPALGVNYQDDRTVPARLYNAGDPGAGTIDEWHRSASWPPAEAQSRVLYLSGRSLAPSPGPGDRTFASVTRTGESIPWATMLCADELDGGYPHAAVYVSDPVPQTVEIAGGPFVYASVSNGSKPDGLVSFTLFEIEPERFSCGSGLVDGVRMLTFGAADLRYHAGGYTAKPFPIGEATPVRVDLTGLAARIDAGHRLALVASYGDLGPGLATDGSGASVLTIHGGASVAASQLVLPVTGGVLGTPPAISYPPRPWAPAAAK